METEKNPPQPADNWETKKVDIDVKHVLPVLATSLYGNDPKCAIRELALQNPLDACLDLIAEKPSEKPEIHIWIDRDRKAIIIEDQGIGMTEDQITQNLAKIGGTSKSAIDEIKGVDAEHQRILAEERIGRFGLGFLAGFIIADQIEVRSKSAKSKAQDLGVEAVFTGDTMFKHRPAKVEKTGTSVTLLLGNEFEGGAANQQIDLMNRDTLKSILRDYGDLLRFPVFLHPNLSDDVGMRVTMNDGPWMHENASDQQYREFYKHRYENTNEPLFIFPVNIDVPLKSDRDDDSRLIANGFLHIPKPPVNEHQEYGLVDLYVKRMYLCQDRDELLPAWATHFVNGLINTPSLTETLDRNDVVRTDRMYTELRLQLGKLLIDNLKEMAARRPQDMDRLMSEHGERIRRAAMGDHEEFFDAIAHSIQVMVFSKEYYGGQRVPFGKYMNELAAEVEEKERTRSIIRYFKHISPAVLQDLVSQQDAAVIDASAVGIYEFLWAYTTRNPDTVILEDVTEDLSNYVQDVPPTEAEKWRQFINYFKNLHSEGMEVHADVKIFEPAEVPALLLSANVDDAKSRDTDAQFEAVLESSAGNLPAVRTALAREREKLQSTAGFYLFINARNKLMTDLLRYNEEDKGTSLPKELELILHEIFHNARIYAGQPQTTETTLHIFEYHNKLISAYVETLNTRKEQDKWGNEWKQQASDLENNRDELIESLREVIKKVRGLGGNPYTDGFNSEDAKRLGIEE